MKKKQAILYATIATQIVLEYEFKSNIRYIAQDQYIFYSNQLQQRFKKKKIRKKIEITCMACLSLPSFKSYHRDASEETECLK